MRVILENINIDKDTLENIDIEKDILGNIDIDKGISRFLENIDVDMNILGKEIFFKSRFQSFSHAYDEISIGDISDFLKDR